MEKTCRYIAIGALVAFSALGAFAAAATGNCKDRAVDLTSRDDGGIQLTLVRLWNSEFGEWEDAAPDNAVKDQAGGYWYKFTIPVGSDCVFYIDPASVISDNGGYYIGIDDVYAEGANSIFDWYDDPTTRTQYWFIRASDWDEADSGNVNVYVCLAGDYPGVKCTFYHYFKGGKTIADFAPPGTELAPIAVDVSSDGSRAAAVSAATANYCCYSASLVAGTRYVFTCKPNGTNDVCGIVLNLANENIEYEYSSYVDGETGECIVKVLPYEDVVAEVDLMAGNLRDCTFSWHQTLVGTFGFTASGYTFADTSGVAVATVRRTSNDVAHRLKWMTVAETAQAGIDYTPMSGEIVFDADGAYSENIAIPLVQGADAAGGTRSFAIRLESIPENDLADGEYSPAPSPRVARIFITPTGEGEPMAEMPEAVDEAPETPLAQGTFKGICESFFSGEVVSMTVRSDGTVSATFGTGAGAYVFEGDTNEVSFAREINGKLWQMYLSVSLPTGTVEDLSTAPCGIARLDGTIFTESGNVGEIEERVVSCELYREESRLNTETLDRMEGKAGRYTIALVPPGDIAEYVDEYSGATNNGYLAVNVSPGGQADIFGVLPLRGGAIGQFAATAYDTEYGLAIPFCFESEAGSLAGTLKIGNGGCEILYDSAVPVLATGGKYDYWTDLARLYNGWILSADEECVLAGTELSVSDGEFVAGDVSTHLSLDRASGVISGTNAQCRFSAVLLNYAMSQGAQGAVGFAVDAAGKSYPARFLLNWTDPNWSEHWGISVDVGFDANGASGTAPASMTVELGGKITMPQNPFTRVGYEFGGWRAPSSGNIYAAGQEINVPAEDTNFLAHWIDRRLSVALDTDLAVSTTSENAWVVEGTSSGVAGGGDSFLKANVDKGNSYAGGFFVDVSGPGKISFWWKLVRRIDILNTTLDDRISVSVDNVEYATIAGADSNEFSHVEIEIDTPGQHRIAWNAVGSASRIPTTAVKNAAVIAVDCVTWESTSTDTALVTFDPGEGATVSPTSRRVKIGEAIGPLPTPVCDTRDFVCWTNSLGETATAETPMPKKGLSLSAKWDMKTWTVSFAGGGATAGSVPAPMSAKEGEQIALPSEGTLSMGGDWEFIGWTDGESLHPAATLYTVPGSNVTLTAEWGDARLKNALDTDLAVSTTSENAWVVEGTSSGVAGGGDSFLKANVDKGNSYAGGFFVDVSGPGKISFWWKLVRRIDILNTTLDDRISVSVDNVEYATIAGADSNEFSHVEIEIDTPGQHRIAWNAVGSASRIPTTAVKNAAVIAVDCVTWESTSTDTALVTFDPGEGATVSPTSRRVKIGEAIGPLPTPVCDTRDFVCWTNSLGETATAETPMPKKGLSLSAKWDMKTWTVSFAGGGATAGSVPAPMSAKEGEQIALPSEGTLSMGGDWEFIGWTDGESLHPAATLYTVPGSNVTLTAEWGDARLKNALDTDLAVSTTSENAWVVEGTSSGVAGGGDSFLKANVDKGNSYAGGFFVDVSGPGKISFWWKLVRRIDILNTTLDDRISVSVDNVEYATIAGADSNEFSHVEIEIDTPGQHRIAWNAVGSASRIPTTAVKNAAVIAVDCVTWTPAAPVDFSNAEVVATTEPADLGITNGTFAAESAGSTNLVKLVAWAKEYDITVAEVNAMTFTKDPQTTLEKAYLLNCSEEEVEEKASELRIASIQVGADGTVTIEPTNGSDSGNGHVEVRSSLTIDGEFTAEDKPGNHTTMFFRIYLVK